MLKRTIAVIGIIASIVGTTTISANAAWKKDNIGWWYTEGNSWAIGWRNIYGQWYYFDNSGYMKTGWLLDGGKWYYLDNSGYMKTGWLLDGGKWYYLNSNGVMLSNTVTEDGYTLNSDGSWNTSIPKKTNYSNESSLSNIVQSNADTEVLTRYNDTSTNNEDKVINKNSNNNSTDKSNNQNNTTNNNSTDKSNNQNNTTNNNSADKSNNQNNTTNDNSVSEDTISKEEFYNIVCDKMYELVNKHRKNNGVDKLKRDSGLDESAYLKSKHMMDNNYFDHDFKGKSAFELTKELWGQDIYGENIAMNYCSGVYTEKNAQSLAENIFTQWKNSSGHNENMLRESFDTFGFGFVITKSNKVLATQQFGINNSVNTNYSDYDTDDEVENSSDSSGWKLMDKDGSNITVPDDGYEYSLEVKKTSKGSYYKLIKGDKKIEDKKQTINNENNDKNNNENNDKNEELNDNSISKIHGKSELKESIYEHFKNHDESWELYYYGNSGDNKAEINDVLGDFLYKNNEFKQSIDAFGIGSGDDKTFFKITLYYK